MRAGIGIFISIACIARKDLPECSCLGRDDIFRSTLCELGLCPHPDLVAITSARCRWPLSRRKRTMRVLKWLLIANLGLLYMRRLCNKFLQITDNFMVSLGKLTSFVVVISMLWVSTRWHRLLIRDDEALSVVDARCKYGSHVNPVHGILHLKSEFHPSQGRQR